MNNFRKIHIAFLTIIISVTTVVLIKLFWLGKIEGEANIPDKPCVVISNHASYLDFLLIGYALNRATKKQFRFWAKTKVVNHFLWKTYSSIFKTIEVKVNSSNLYKSSIQALNKGEFICIFPEGTRTRNGELLQFKEGYLKFASKVETDIVPVFIENTYEAWPSDKLLPKALKCNITFYPSVKISKDASCFEIEEINLLIMKKYDCWRKEFHHS